MPDSFRKDDHASRSNLDRFTKKIESREKQKVSAQHHTDRTLRIGLSAFGVIGWSIAAPTLIGILLGVWIDRRWPSDFSWTLALLLAGVSLGCLSAWIWVSKEQKNMNDPKDKNS